MVKRIKILFLIPNLMHGGAERVLVNLVNNMNPNEFDITVETMFDTGIYKNKLNQNIKYIGGFPYYFKGNTFVYKLFSPKQLYNMYIKENYDIIVSYLEGMSARVVSGDTRGEKKICWIHIQMDTENYLNQVFRNKKEVNYVYKNFDKLIFVSETVMKNFDSILKLNIPKTVIYNTVETDIIIEKSNEKIDDLKFYKNKINIISVAKLMKSKGYDRLIRISKKLKDDNIPIHIYIVGKGEEEKNLKKMIEDLNLQNDWTFVGFKENPYKYVKNADLYVCSSYKEGFSTSVTEALIVGCPVVSVNCSGAYELLGYNNEYGIVTENNEDALYEGIKKIINEPGMLEYYKKQSVIRGEKFNKEETVKTAENMFKEILKK